MEYDRVEGECFGCGGPAKPGMLMCWNDWRRVPRIIQRAVWGSNYLAHPDHEASRLAARAAVGAKEGIPPAEEEVLLLARYGVGPDGHPARIIPDGGERRG